MRCETPALSQHVLFLLAAERKRSVLVEVIKVFLWRQEAGLFRHAQIMLPVSGVLVNYYFCIIFILAIFILLSFFISS